MVVVVVAAAAVVAVVAAVAVGQRLVCDAILLGMLHRQSPPLSTMLTFRKGRAGCPLWAFLGG